MRAFQWLMVTLVSGATVFGPGLLSFAQGETPTMAAPSDAGMMMGAPEDKNMGAPGSAPVDSKHQESACNGEAGCQSLSAKKIKKKKHKGKKSHKHKKKKAH